MRKKEKTQKKPMITVTAKTVATQATNGSWSCHVSNEQGSSRNVIVNSLSSLLLAYR